MNSFTSIAKLAEMSRTQGPIDFVSIDTETANPARSSLCAIGLSLVVAGEVAATATELVNPECEFSKINTRIHKIDGQAVTGAPMLTELWPSISEICSDRDLVFHNAPFDVGVIRSTAARYELVGFTASTTCTLRLARRVWPTAPSYGLKVLASTLGIPLDHHDAGSDASACAHLALALMRDSNVLTIEDLHSSLGSRPGRWTSESFSAASFRTAAGTPSLTSQAADPGADGSSPLHGLTVCMTGTLDSMTRAEARDLACSVGAAFVNGMSSKVDLLIVGEVDYLTFAGGHQNGKLAKAAEMRANGKKGPEIVREADFLQMLAQA